MGNQLQISKRLRNVTAPEVPECPPLTDEQFTKERFSDTVAIVTGGALGIGEATVKRFANDGATVIIFDINSTLGEEVATSLAADGYRVEFMTVDVSDRDQCIQAVNTVAEKHEKVNFLINGEACSGVSGNTGKAEKWPTETMSVKIQGYSNMVQACHPHMLKAARGQRAIVNIASASNLHIPTFENLTAYYTIRGAILTLTKCIALNLVNDGIRVNSVTTAIVTGLDANIKEVPSKYKTLAKYHMLNRLGEPSEIAGAITFLCSRDSSFITAADFPVDGGCMGMSVEQDEKLWDKVEE